MLLDLKEDKKEPVCISSDFVAATDAAVSFDRQRLLFAGKKTSDAPWQVYELSLARHRTRLVARREADCLMPIYLPDRTVVFVSPREVPASLPAVSRGAWDDLALFRVEPGHRVSAISFSVGSVIEPAVMNDGRLIYGFGPSLKTTRGGQSRWALFESNSDGTGVQGVTAADARRWLMRSPAVGPDDQVGYVAADRWHPFAAGELRLFSINDAGGEHTAAVTEAVGLVADVAAAPAGGWSAVVSSPTWLLSMRPAGGATFGLYRWDGKRAVLLHANAGYHMLRPVMLAKRPRPNARLSVVDRTVPWGLLLCQNVYTTSPRLAEHIPPGSVHAVRVLQGLPRNNRGRGAGDAPSRFPPTEAGLVPPPATRVRILGEVPVESDGSFTAKVPPDRPLRLQLIDQEGFVAVDEKSWFWLRPNESRLCIGCHEDPELSFENVVSEAMGRPPADLTDPGGWRQVSFRQQVFPMLNRTCGVVDCHRPPDPTAGLNLSNDEQIAADASPSVKRFGPAYSHLMAAQPGKPASVGGRLVHPGDARESPLLWMLYGRQLGRGYSAAPFDRQITGPHLEEGIPDETLSLLREWIETGAAYDDGSETNDVGAASRDGERTEHTQ